MSEIHKLESEILQLEEVLFVLDNDLERIFVERQYIERRLRLVEQNLTVLKNPEVITMLDTYRKAKLEKKFLQDRFLNMTKTESEIDKKIKAIEKEVFKKENKKTELLNQISIEKVLVFKAKQ